MEGQPTPPPAEKKKGSPWTIVGLALLGLYVLILVILNDEKVEVHFLFFTASIRKLVLMLLCLAIGFLAGVLFDHWRARRSSR